jgi:ADP-ribose pyrophosphatase
LNYYEIDYSDDKGNHKSYEMVSRTGSKCDNGQCLDLDTLGEKVNAVAAIVLNPSHDKMLLNKEFRFGVNKFVYNTIAGLIDPGETPEQAIARELHEETGLRLTKIIAQLPPSYTCAPITDEKITMFICEAEGEILGSDNVLEEIYSSWYDKDAVKWLVQNSKNAFSGRMQAFAYMWASGL